MDEDRPGIGVAHVSQHRQEVREVMAVDRPDMVEPEFLEERATGPVGARHLLGARRAALPPARQAAGKLPRGIAQAEIGRGRGQAREIGGDRADRLGDPGAAVGKDDDKALVAHARAVQRLVGHARGERVVADDAHHVVAIAAQVPRDRLTEPRRDRVRWMRLARLRGAGARRRRIAIARGEDRVRARLAAVAEHKPVSQRIEDAMQRYRQLRDVGRGTGMPAIGQRRGGDLPAQLGGKPGQLALGQGMQVGGRAYRGQERHPRRMPGGGQVHACADRRLLALGRRLRGQRLGHRHDRVGDEGELVLRRREAKLAWRAHVEAHARRLDGEGIRHPCAHRITLPVEPEVQGEEREVDAGDAAAGFADPAPRLRQRDICIGQPRRAQQGEGASRGGAITATRPRIGVPPWQRGTQEPDPVARRQWHDGARHARAPLLAIPASVPELAIRLRDVGGGGELAVDLGALDDRDAHAAPFRDGGIVGEVEPALGGGGAMRGEDRLESEALRRLRPVEPVARDGAANKHPRGVALERVGDRQRGDRAGMFAKRREHAVDQVVAEEGARRVVDQHDVGRDGGERLQPHAHRVLARGAAGHGIEQAPAQPLRRRVIGEAVVGMEDHEDRRDARMRREHAQRAREHGNGADMLVLLRHAIRLARARPTPRRDDEAGDLLLRHVHPCSLLRART